MQDYMEEKKMKTEFDRKKYISENNLKISGDCYEIYHIERHITEDENEFITEIQIPVTL